MTVSKTEDFPFTVCKPQDQHEIVLTFFLRPAGKPKSFSRFGKALRFRIAFPSPAHEKAGGAAHVGGDDAR